MSDDFFEWDDAKAAANRIKHDVSFDEAKQVFNDRYSDSFDDPEHSDDEDRFVIIGATFTPRLLFVSFVELGDKLRIISAREVTPQERYDYENQP